MRALTVTKRKPKTTTSMAAARLAKAVDLRSGDGFELEEENMRSDDERGWSPDDDGPGEVVFGAGWGSAVAAQKQVPPLRCASVGMHIFGGGFVLPMDLKPAVRAARMVGSGLEEGDEAAAGYGARAHGTNVGGPESDWDPCRAMGMVPG